MSVMRNRASSLLAAAWLTVLGAHPAGVLADDTEIFIAQNNTGVKPNILFVLDTSGSMRTDVVTENAPYNPNQTYSGNCSSSRVYWVRSNSNVPPSCSTDQWVNASAFQCKAALDAFPTTGYFAAEDAAQYDHQFDTRWEELRASTKDRSVECRADAGIHGDGGNAKWATDTGSIKWSTNSAEQISWQANNTGRDYYFYSANYLNWHNNPSTFVTKSRLQIMQEVIADLLNSVSGVNVGLMRYSNNTNDSCGNTGTAEGGMVTFAMKDIDSGTARQDMTNIVNGYTADGCTPLSETLYEALQYFRNGTIKYGNNSRVSPNSGGQFPSVPLSREGGSPSSNIYRSPMQFACQKNFIVYLTDGLPTADNSANTDIQGLIGGSCNGSGSGHCLDDLAGYMFETDLHPALADKQNVISHWIGFGPEVSGSAFLQTTANRGGGKFYSADNTLGLAAALTTIVSEILKTNTTFTAPSVSVNAFNRTQTLNDLYVSVFRPASTFRWPGNVKKYTIEGGQIRDADGATAVNPATGFFSDSARSFWSTGTDGSDVELGGAANRLPADPATRKVYTNVTPSSNPQSGDLTLASNDLHKNNVLITDLILGTGTPGQPSRDRVLDWARGYDVDGPNPSAARRSMGDPLHAKPAVVIYGGTEASPNVNDAVVYVPTNNGFLHAIDVNTGDELWAFMPFEQLGDLVDLYLNTAVQAKHYGLDAEVRTLVFDQDQNGIVEPSEGDRVILYLGQGRGGSNYYAVDVTVKTQPKLLWTRTAADLPGLGQTWSSPTLTRVNIAGAAQNSQKLVLVFAGGYDDTQDTYDYNTDGTGNGLYMIDALTGALLWRASKTSGNFQHARMEHSIPANLALLDLDGDTFADRMYVGDMGGLVWRFDITNGNNANSLVAGGVFADLGAASLGSPKPRSETRRFYNMPDIALARRRNKATYFNVGIGSGYRGHPLDQTMQDRFYALRDYKPFTKLTQAQYDAFTPITDGGLVDVTTDLNPTIPDGSPGWKIELRSDSSWVGEKVLAESRTFNNVIFFPTYLPNTASSNACSPAAGSNRVYALSLFDGRPVLEQDGVFTDADNDGVPDADNVLSITDRFVNLRQGGIAPEIAFLFPGREPHNPNDPNPPDPNEPPPGQGGGGDDENKDPVVCLSGAEVLGACSNFLARVKTFWRESGAD